MVKQDARVFTGRWCMCLVNLGWLPKREVFVQWLNSSPVALNPHAPRPTPPGLLRQPHEPQLHAQLRRGGGVGGRPPHHCHVRQEEHRVR